MAFLAEGFAYLVITLLVAIVEFYVSGPLTDFALSNWWIGLAIMAIWNVVTWPRAQTPTGSLLDQFIADADTGEGAGFARVALRQVVRFGVLYALPIIAIDWFALRGRIAFLSIAVATGLLLRYVTAGRAPWDLLANTVVTDSLEGDEVTGVVPTSPADLQLQGERVKENRRAGRLMLFAALMSVVISALIVWNIFSEAFEFIAAEEFSWASLREIGWFPRRGLFDLSTLFVGTLWTVVIAMAVAGPIGLGVAFYLSEYASARLQRIVKPIIEMLASIPSVVLGFFAISFISPDVLKRFFFPEIGIFSLLSAGIGVGILTIPIVASISEDAMRAVPRQLREASYGLGARRATTALRVVFPAALSGISAAFIVGISRAIGETMVVFIAAGGSGGAIFESNPTSPGQTITAAMASLGAGTDSVAGSGIAFQSLYFLGALLFIMTLLLNVASDAIVRRFREAY